MSEPSRNPTARVRGYDVWLADSMTRVFPLSPPGRQPARLKAHLHLAGNESQGFQIVLRPRRGRELGNVRLVCEPLRGQTRIDAEHIQWQQVGYVRVEHMEYVKPSGRRPIQENVNLALAGGAQIPGWWPDPLLPVERFQVSGEFAQPVWVTVHVPPGTPAGDCAGSISIIPENAPSMQVEIHATVHPFALPQGAGTFPTAFALMEKSLRQVYGSVDRAMIRQWGDYVLGHRLNPDDIYRTTPPDVEDLEYFLGRGMNAFNVVNNRITRNSQELGRVTRQALDQIPPFLERLRQSPQAQALFERAYYYGFDEITVDQVHHMQEEFRIVREQFGLPTFTTAHLPQSPADFRRTNTDWLCPLTSWLDAGKVAHCRQAGFKVWTYISLEPDPPYANWRLDNPLIEARILPWQCYQQQMDGLLYWGFNAWSPWHPTQGKPPIDVERDGPFLDWSVASGDEGCTWLHGDGILLYPGTRGPIGCIRLANIRDGLQDYEYLNLLAQRSGCPRLALEACAPITTDWTTFTRDPAVLRRQRALIARRIEGWTR